MFRNNLGDGWGAIGRALGGIADPFRQNQPNYPPLPTTGAQQGQPPMMGGMPLIDPYHLEPGMINPPGAPTTPGGVNYPYHPLQPYGMQQLGNPQMQDLSTMGMQNINYPMQNIGLPYAPYQTQSISGFGGPQFQQPMFSQQTARERFGDEPLNYLTTLR